MAHRYLQQCRKIIAIGRNYALHAAELGNKVPETPFWFLKPTTSIIHNGSGASIAFPEGCQEMRHEIELGVFIGVGGKAIKASDAMKHVGGYCVALDMTARDWQEAAKKRGLPWTQAKGFDTSCPLGAVIPAGRVEDPHALTLWCTVNGEQRQRGSTGDMLVKIPELIEVCSRVHTLEEGDLILTGTPAGVGAVRPGDVIRGGLEELGEEVEFGVV